MKPPRNISQTDQNSVYALIDLISIYIPLTIVNSISSSFAYKLFGIFHQMEQLAQGSPTVDAQ